VQACGRGQSWRRAGLRIAISTTIKALNRPGAYIVDDWR
jgi:hypothetical protein